MSDLGVISGIGRVKGEISYLDQIKVLWPKQEPCVSGDGGYMLGALGATDTMIGVDTTILNLGVGGGGGLYHSCKIMSLLLLNPSMPKSYS